MIRISRTPGSSPFKREMIARLEQQAREFYGQGARTRRQTFENPGLAGINQQAREPLMRLFNEKCAYCETSVGASSGGYVDLFRPKRDASSLGGRGDPDHYGWLAYEWENIYLACPACSRAKRSLFPVIGLRAPVLAPIRQVRELEAAILIDPCIDAPEAHLAFVESGLVEPLSDRGETTIKVLNLNRSQLVRQRALVWARVAEMVRLGLMEQAVRETLPSAPWSAAGRAALSATERGGQAAPGGRFVDTSQARSAADILAADEEAFRLTARSLRRVRITNFRALRDVDIQFVEPGSEAAPWLTLLGENATGKSTALHAIALTLAGAREAGRLTRPSRVLSAGAGEGVVEVWFWDHDEPAELRFVRGRRRFSGTLGPSAIVLAYGALRYAERRTRRNDAAPRFSRIAPLIEPIARIRYPGSWIADLDDKHFDTVARSMLSILPEGASALVQRRRDGRIAFDLNGHTASLPELSAGYQAIVGMCADIMRLLFERWDTLTSATAIVLIDEIDAHLHPRWAMRIVGVLRSVFPQVQFITSTHNPLTLRGLRNGEVALVRLEEQRGAVIDQNLPAIEGMWVDELLTSRVFGLESTADPDVERLLQEYYYLRSAPYDPGNERRIAEIRERVGDREALGRSDSERLMLEAAKTFVESVDEEDRRSGSLRDETLRRLAAIAASGARGRLA